MAAAGASGMVASDIPPNQTLYVNNLNEKLKKPALKKALFAVFSQFGRILDIVALKTLKMRGQAFVVFADVTSASNALRQMQGFPFYDKPMCIQFAKGKSDVVARRDGTFIPRDKRKRVEESKEAAGRSTSKRAASGAGVKSSAGSVMVPAPAVNAMPNKILIARGLPAEATQDVLKALFEQYAGYKEVRTSAGTGIAFIEFQDSMQATAAMQALNNFKLSPTHSLNLSFARS